MRVITTGTWSFLPWVCSMHHWKFTRGSQMHVGCRRESLCHASYSCCYSRSYTFSSVIRLPTCVKRNMHSAEEMLSKMFTTARPRKYHHCCKVQLMINFEEKLGNNKTMFWEILRNFRVKELQSYLRAFKCFHNIGVENWGCSGKFLVSIASECMNELKRPF